MTTFIVHSTIWSLSTSLLALVLFTWLERSILDQTDDSRFENSFAFGVFIGFDLSFLGLMEIAAVVSWKCAMVVALITMVWLALLRRGSRPQLLQPSQDPSDSCV